MTLTPLFQIDGKPLYAPDADVSPSYADLDSSDSGRGRQRRHAPGGGAGEGGHLALLLRGPHRRRVRLPGGAVCGKATFAFTHPRAGSSTGTVTTTCYCSNYSIAWRSARDGTWRNLKFNIIEC